MKVRLVQHPQPYADAGQEPPSSWGACRTGGKKLSRQALFTNDGAKIGPR